MRYFIVLLILSLVIVSACYEGNGLDPVAGIEDASGIRGTITFTGVWPDSTKEVRAIAMSEYPVGITDNDSLLAFMLNAFNTGQMVMGDTLSRFADTVEFEIDARAGLYEWVLVAWFPDIPLHIMGVKQLGAYTIESGTSHSSVRVMPGSYTENIDMTADLGRALGDRVFYKAGLTHE